MQLEELTPYAGRKRTNLLRFNGINEFAGAHKRQKYIGYKRRHATDHTWTGATWEVFKEELDRGSLRYAAAADKYLEHFSNAALETVGYGLDYNYEQGFLDAGMYNAGDPMCLYGNSVVESDRAPVRVYVDTWISSTISPSTILNRGVAVLALVRAVSIYRPVILEMVGGWHSSYEGMDGIVTCAAPTNPMDLARAAWMVAAPQFVRMGMMSMFWECVQSDKNCGMPMLSAGSTWQTCNLGKFLAEKDGADPENVVFLPMMYDSGIWRDQKSCLEWIKIQAARFMPVLEAT